MKVIVCTRDLDLGGTGSHVKMVLRGYERDKGIEEVLVIGPKELEGYNSKIKFLVLGGGGKYFITRVSNFALKCDRILKNLSRHYDRIESHYSFYAREYKVPLVIKFHGLHKSIIRDYPKTPKFILASIFHKVYSYFDYMTIKYASKVLFVSKKTMEEAKRFYPQFRDKFHHSPNSIDKSKFPKLSLHQRIKIKKELKLDDNKKNILYVGRLEPLKGVSLLIETIKDINDHRIRLLVIGDGPLKREVNRYDSVKYIGKILNNELFKYYNAADLFVLPSYYENCPMTVLEALSCGCQILASNVGDNGFYLNKDDLFYINNKDQLKAKIKERLKLEG